MRAEKGGSKSSGFFNLFDWNRKSRKKLFTISPEGSKIGRRIEEPILPSCLRMMDEEEAMAISSIKGSSDYSCASSINSDDLNGSKPAGVVARLMGLDSLPVSALSDLNSTPFNSFRDPIINNNSNYNINNYNNNNNNNYARKMPSSPIERFQMEALPSNRSVKSLPNNYHNKLLSPIKNPNFVYGRNASQIMEAAAKIIESSNNNNSSSSNMREKVCLTGRVNGLRVDPLRSDKGSSRLLRMNRGFERGLNREEDIVIIRSSSPDSYEGNNNINININNSNNINLGSSNNNSGLSGRGNKGKSVSLAIQAKVNVQKREGVNLSNRSYGSVHRENGTGNSPGTSNQRTGMIKQQKKGSTGSSSPVLRQNNQKQNCIGNRAGKSGSAKSTQSQQARKSETLNSTRQKSRLSSNLKPRKENFEISNSNESGKDFPQKKRLIDRTNNSTNNNNNNINNSNNNVNVNTKGKNSVLVDEYTKFNKETKDTTDVVSFTFTSPLLKQTGDSSFASQKLGLVTKGNKDALSLLLENKLRELTNKTNEKLIDFGNSDLGFDLRGKEIERNLGFEFEFEEREKDGVFDFSNDQSFRVMEKGECSKKNDIYEYEENKQLSPFSVFGEESCSTSESSNSIDGSKVSPSSVQAQNTSASSKNFLSSPSQLDTSSTKLFRISKFNNPELDYITDIISNTDLENMFLEGAQLDSPFFDKLERKRSRTELENDDSSSSSLSLNDRRLLYDCVKECLGNKLEVNFINKGIFSRGEGIFPMNKEVYGQIEGWRKMRDLDVDEVVEKDMVVKKDYTADSIMICTDLEAEVLDSLIEGLVGELM